jgi:predicted lipoprotein with Yx(FWY)xxD motif
MFNHPEGDKMKSLFLTAIVLSSSTAFADMTTYTYDVDQPGVSNCYQACARAWPPVTTTQNQLGAPLGVITRTDGTKQVTFNDQPLYFYIGDQTPADHLGDGLGGVWHVASPRF